MLSPELLALLVCPYCHRPLKLVPDGKWLKCGGCRRAYPIRNDILILLKEEGKVEPE